MALNHFLSFDWTDRRNLYIATTVPLIGLGLVSAARTLWPRTRKHSIVLASPRKSLQLLSATQLDQVPYPSDALPGGRDVDTPYGVIRVYEWGPETGRKVLCVHGISTPAISFAGLAKRLVDEQGCRVMTFDLFGRGYSDAPDPAIYRQDIQLFSSQILLALSSSDLAWMGPERFSLVGYSLGGGIAVNFTSYFPGLVESLVLIAPAGLIRPHHISGASKLLYGDVLPEVLIEYMVTRRLKGGHPHTSGKKEEKKDVGDAAAAEIPKEEAGHTARIPNSDGPIFPGRPGISVADTVRWQTEVHEGFLKSFISSIKFAPILNQHDRWRLIASRQEAAKPSAEAENVKQALKERKVLMLLGRDDKVILSDEVEEDAIGIMGAEFVKAIQLEGAHDVPIVNAEGCALAIKDFWASST